MKDYVHQYYDALLPLHISLIPRVLASSALLHLLLEQQHMPAAAQNKTSLGAQLIAPFHRCCRPPEEITFSRSAILAMGITNSAFLVSLWNTRLLLNVELGFLDDCATLPRCLSEAAPSLAGFTALPPIVRSAIRSGALRAPYVESCLVSPAVFETLSI